MVTKFDKGILVLAIVVVAVLAASTYLKLGSDLVMGLLTTLGTLLGFGVGKKTDPNA